MKTDIANTGANARKTRRGAKAPDGIIAARAIGRRPFDPIAYQAALEILG